MEKIRDTLYNYGLSKEQVEIYLRLAGARELRIQGISDATKIPRSSVYEHLKQLEEFGLVEVVIYDTYKSIRAKPVTEMRHHLEEKAARLHTLSKELPKLDKKLALTLGVIPDSQVQVRYFKDVAGARQLLWNTLHAKNTVYVYSAWGRSSFVGTKFYENFVEESKTRDICEQVLINPTPSAISSIQQHLSSSTSRTYLQDIHCLSKSKLCIQGETFIYNNTYSQIYLKNDVISGFEIESNQFVESQRSIFDTLLGISKPIFSYLD